MLFHMAKHSLFAPARAQQRGTEKARTLVDCCCVRFHTDVVECLDVEPHYERETWLVEGLKLFVRSLCSSSV